MRLLNFGSCNIDYVYQIDHVVNDGETEHSYQLNIYPRGKGLNVSVAIGRAGVQVFHAAVLGSDGAFLSDVLMKSGVDVSLSKFVDEKMVTQ